LWVLISKKKQLGNGSTTRNGGDERTGERAKPGREGGRDPLCKINIFIFLNYFNMLILKNIILIYFLKKIK
jgi:hypothetical protein